MVVIFLRRDENQSKSLKRNLSKAQKSPKKNVTAKKPVDEEPEQSRKTLTYEFFAKETERIIGQIAKNKRVEVHFNFLAFGRFGFIGAKVG